jgi:hypothetical protein
LARAAVLRVGQTAEKSLDIGLHVIEGKPAGEPSLAGKSFYAGDVFSDAAKEHVEEPAFELLFHLGVAVEGLALTQLNLSALSERRFDGAFLCPSKAGRYRPSGGAVVVLLGSLGETPMKSAGLAAAIAVIMIAGCKQAPPEGAAAQPAAKAPSPPSEQTSVPPPPTLRYSSPFSGSSPRGVAGY